MQKIEINAISSQDTESLNMLLQALSPGCRRRSWEHFQRILLQSQTYLATFREPSSQEVVGMASLVVTIQPVGVFGRIEDVVVLPQYQGNGIGKSLVATLVEYAESMGLEAVKLTSSPNRKKANALYMALGFASEGTTNKYKLEFISIS